MSQTTRTQAIADGLGAMAIAWSQKYGRPIDPSILRMWGAQILAESNFGRNYGQKGYDGRPEVFSGTNNYGAFDVLPAFVAAHKNDLGYGEVQHADNTASGQPETPWFRVFPTQLTAARDWLDFWGHLLEVHDVAATPEAYATVFYGYYTGTHGTKEERIAAYASMLEGTLPAVDAVIQGLTAGNLVSADPSKPTGDDFVPNAKVVFFKGPLAAAPPEAGGASASPVEGPSSPSSPSAGSTPSLGGSPDAPAEDDPCDDGEDGTP